MSTMKHLEVIKNRDYGNYRCSCGCGKILGNPEPAITDNSYAYGIADVTDDEGYAWRMFTPECWKRVCKEWELEVQADMSSYDYQFTLNKMYNEYPASEEV